MAGSGAVASVATRSGEVAPHPHHLAPRRRAFEWCVVAVAIALRVPFIAAPAGPDEAGFLQVAAQWSPGGGSLYGHYWVDRPPLLITLFQVAAATGGVVPLRLLGCLAVALTVLLSARTAELLAGPAASRWTAATVGILLVAPQLGGQAVNGELLAAPFVAAGVLALVATVWSPDRVWLPFLGGAAGACAVLVKQNVGDVAVFAVVLLLAARRQGCGHLAGLALGAGTGAMATLLVAAAWTLAHGTAPAAVFEAMYAFRIEAGRTLSDGGGLEYARTRAGSLALAWLSSGLALLTVALVPTARRWARSPVLVALVATAGFDLASVAAGGGYWHHYLVQIVVPLAVLLGVLAAHGSRAATMAILTTVALCAIPAVDRADQVPTSTTPGVIGSAIAAASRPGDTLTTLYGQPQVNQASGLPSPYPYLWSLPVKTLDPHLTQLGSLLAGPDAPTWLVVKHHLASWGLDSDRAAYLVAARYHEVGEFEGQSVYLLDGVDRPAPDFGASAPSAATGLRGSR